MKNYNRKIKLYKFYKTNCTIINAHAEKKLERESFATPFLVQHYICIPRVMIHSR